MEGTVLWFNSEKRHGFIRTEDGERLLVEEDGLAPGHELGDRCRGTAVTFEREEAGRGPRAVGVSIVPLYASRRARSRHSR